MVSDVGGFGRPQNSRHQQKQALFACAVNAGGGDGGMTGRTSSSNSSQTSTWGSTCGGPSFVRNRLRLHIEITFHISTHGCFVYDIS